uniref:Uncharacterized protein n=1 Tax=Lepeophtheirus salmonis TaxID=72036 RepID=A0A0K2UDP6_LEPSM
MSMNSFRSTCRLVGLSKVIESRGVSLMNINSLDDVQLIFFFKEKPIYPTTK